MWNMSHHFCSLAGFVTSPWSLVSFLSTTRSPPFIDAKICRVVVVLYPNIAVRRGPVGVFGIVGIWGCGHTFLTTPLPLWIFHDHNFTLILVLLCDLTSIHAREHSVFFFRRKGAGKVLIYYDLSEFADV